MKSRLLGILLVCGITAGMALADHHETTGGSGGSYKHELSLNGTTASGTFTKNTTANTVFIVGLGYDYFFTPDVQFGTRFAWVHSANGTKTDTLRIIAGPTLNFPFDGNPQDTFYIFGGAGLNYAKAGAASATKFAFAFEAGKRFQLAKQLNWKPSVGILKVGGSDMAFIVTPVAFSALFE